jgi:molecular chaperone DnaK
LSRFIGIDLGTTYSSVATINEDGKAEVIPNEYGHTVTPSVIFFGHGNPIVGDEAKEYQAAGHTEVASFFKRSMGDTEFLLAFQGHDYSPIDLSALVLRYMKQTAERFFKAAVTDAVITVPAYFRNMQRAATIEAGNRAGLKVLKIISEPTAAALAYGLRPGHQAQEQRVLVYDLGGGTFDISLVAITPSDLRIIGTDGDDNLGGKDWDDRLITHLETQFEQEFGVELLGDDINELRVQAEQLKRTLSARQSATIRVQAKGHIGNYTITRKQFEDLSKDLMERTQMLTEQVLRTANLSWQHLSGVLPVGGSTRMPMVADYIRRMSGKPPMGGIHPEEAVSLGAAMQAAIEVESMPGATPTYLLPNRKITVDAIAHSLGLIVESKDRSRYVNSRIIRKNLPIPARETQLYEMNMRRDGSTQLEVFLTQSESEDPLQCSYLGRYVFSNFPPVRGETALLDITYEYDKNGVVHISACEKRSGQPLTLTVYPVPQDIPARFVGRPSEQIVREPMTVYLVIDRSWSMAGRPLREAKRAAEQFVRQCDLSSTAIGLISFCFLVRVEQEATKDAQHIYQAINRLHPGSGTAGSSLNLAYDVLKKVPGRRYAIVLTDGQWQHQGGAVRKARQCHEAGIQIVAIGFGAADPRFLNKIASSSAQSFFTDVGRLTETFSTIARELL